MLYIRQISAKKKIAQLNTYIDAYMKENPIYEAP